MDEPYTMLNTVRAKGVDSILVLEVSEDVDMVLEKHGVHVRDYERTKQVFAAEGKRLSDALRAHLPGGVYDALLGAMLHEKATVFHVPHDEKLYCNFTPAERTRP